MKDLRPWLVLGLLPLGAWTLFLFSAIPETLTVSGVLDYRNVTCLSAPFPGEVVQAVVRPGQRVEPGDLLFVMNSRELEEDLLSLRRQISLQNQREKDLLEELELAEKTWQTEEALLLGAVLSFQSARNSLPPREGDRRSAEFELGRMRHQSGLLRIRSEIRESQILSEGLEQRITEREKKISLREIVSPGKGIFLLLPGPLETQGLAETRTGQRVPEGMPLGYVADPGELDLKAEVDVQFRERLLLLDSVAVKLPEYLASTGASYRQERILEFPVPGRSGKCPVRISWLEDGRAAAGTVVELKFTLRPSPGKS